jgi:hypothetical protein
MHNSILIISIIITIIYLKKFFVSKKNVKPLKKDDNFNVWQIIERFTRIKNNSIQRRINYRNSFSCYYKVIVNPVLNDLISVEEFMDIDISNAKQQALEWYNFKKELLEKQNRDLTNNQIAKSIELYFVHRTNGLEKDYLLIDSNGKFIYENIEKEISIIN